jgi:integrase
MTKLTTASLKAKLKKPGRHGDGEGLFFRVLPGDKAYWVYRYRVMVDGRSKEREMSLGTYPEKTLAQARDLHTAERNKVRNDKIDPLADKQAAKALAAAPTPTGKPSFGEVADQYVATHEASWRNDKHRDQWRMTLTAHCAAIRSTPIDKVDTAAVLRVLKPIWGKTPETASRLRGRIEKVLDAARVLGHIDADKANPARWAGHLKEVLPNPKKIGERGHHAALPYAEVPAFAARLKSLPGTSAKALLFTILTAARSGEVFGMAFDEVDLDSPTNGSAAGLNGSWAGPTWTVPASRMKMRKAHRVPLSPAAVDILKDQRANSGPKQTYVFESPITQGSKVHRDAAHQPLSNMAFAMLLRRMGANEITAHGFRSAFRDWVGDETSFQRETAEAALAHLVGDKAEQAYRRGDAFKKRRELMEAWSSYVMGDGEAAKVVPLAAAKGRKGGGR